MSALPDPDPPLQADSDSEPSRHELRLVPGVPHRPHSWLACAGVAGLGGAALAALGLSTPVLAAAGQRAAAASAGSWLFFAGLILAMTALAMARGSRGAVWWLRGVVLLVALQLPQLIQSEAALGALWGALGAWLLASAVGEWAWVRRSHHLAPGHLASGHSA